MQTVGAFEAKTHLSNLLERVSCGETIVITRHGNPIAKLVPFSENESGDLRKTIKEIHQLRSTLPHVGTKDLKAMIDAGRNR
jgi:prevent-host-death family protein